LRAPRTLFPLKFYSSNADRPDSPFLLRCREVYENGLPCSATSKIRRRVISGGRTLSLFSSFSFEILSVSRLGAPTRLSPSTYLLVCSLARESPHPLGRSLLQSSPSSCRSALFSYPTWKGTWMARLMLFPSSLLLRTPCCFLTAVRSGVLISPSLPLLRFLLPYSAPAMGEPISGREIFSLSISHR